MSIRELSLALCLSTIGLAPPAWASGGTDGCDPRWRIDLARFSLCNAVGALVPGNDTRTNLALLLMDGHGVPTRRPPADTAPLLEWLDFKAAFYGPAVDDDDGFPSGQGARCRSNEGGTSGFDAAVGDARGLGADERPALVDARAALGRACLMGQDGRALTDTHPVSIDTSGVTSAIGRQFSTYLEGVEAFYGSSLDLAERDFERIRTSPDPWLSDTAAYMVLRTRVNRLQVGAFEDYGTFKGSGSVDKDLARATEASLDDYVRDHPRGRYLGSAQGLMRRVEWLAGWTDRLAYRYSTLLAQSPSARGIDDPRLVEEVDAKLLPTLTPSATTDPTLLAVADLKAMRRADGSGQGAPARPDLEAQRGAFATAPDLYGYLRAAMAFHVDGDAAAVVRSIPDDTRRRGGDYLWFSRQLLRGEALEAVGDVNARGFWKDLLPGAERPLDALMVQLALALHEERHGRLDDVFAPGSPVTDPRMRMVLLDHVAGPELLRRQASDPSVPREERYAARYDLLLKEVTRGRYDDFLSDVAALPYEAPSAPPPEPGSEPIEAPPRLDVYTQGKTAGEIGCPTLSATASRLARDRASVRDRLCLAEWVRLDDLDAAAPDAPPPPGDLGGSPSTFPGPRFARASVYQAVIDDRAASPDDRAYALYRAVRCYEPSGTNQCGGAEVPKSVRRAWHATLRRDYPTSRWARELRYWW